MKMKERVMNTVHALLQRSGQSVPAKHLSISDRALQVYDVDHWPESFNSLLLHDFPSIIISIDSSVASLSGFVITLQWKPVVDRSDFIRFVAHILIMCVLISYVSRVCLANFHNVPLNSIQEIKEIYIGNSTAGTFGAHGPSSLLTDELRAVMSHAVIM